MREFCQMLEILMSTKILHKQLPFSPQTLIELVCIELHLQSSLFCIQGADDEYRSTFEISSTNGQIFLKKKLDYEKHSFYIFKVGVKDRGEPVLVGKPADFVVTVLDVQDTPPMFVNLPYNTEIKETATVGSSVLRVTGLDGDQGIPNELSYRFVSGDSENFEIDSTTGWITVKASLDRDSASMASNGGVYAMFVQATEKDKPGQQNYGNTTATAIVTISVQDVNDNDPQFSQTHYTAQIHENMQNGVPVTFLGDMMRVADADQGTNSHFALTVEKDGQPFYDFTTLPEEVYTESTVLIRVNNSEALDYEKEKEIIFQIVAREVDTAERRSSTATVTLSILDMNDNAPNFTHSQYLFNVSEDATVDVSIGDIFAVDDDTDSFARVSYTIRGGNDKFRVDSLSGALYVQGQLDRETTSQYYLSAEAIDGGGLRSPAEIQIIVTDVNDNPPLFRRSDYEGVVREKDATFLRPIVVEAVDDDQPTTENSIVHYRIDRTPVGLESNFTINALTGEISLEVPLDYEKLNPDLHGKIVLEVVAHDSGVPKLSSTVFVNITVEDINDFPPVFKPDTYIKHIMENSPEGTSVLTVTATDEDATSPNNDFFYRIESGALDKFRINFDTGEITVESGAKLDREDKQEYHLRISATDRGNPPLTNFSDVTIILDNINDELPRFLQSSDAVRISENADVGQSVFSYVATDTDEGSDLMYTLLKNLTKAFDNNGDEIDISATGVDNYFDVHANNGTIFVSSKLDRETAERVVVKILAEDLNAADPRPQSATATLTVTLQDYNDNPPTFQPSDQFRVNVSEAENINSVILRVMTTDPDKSQQVTYGLERFTTDATGVNYFSIVEATGTVLLQQKLDRENKSSHTFIIVAKDNGVPQQSSSATVFITVADENDNIPQFVAYPATFRVPENVSVGYEVHTMQAKDYDDGDFGAVVYSLEGADNDDGNFQIDPVTGQLTVAKQLDRETKGAYRLEVMARDSDPDVVDQKSRRAALTIFVTDVNDNAPQFLPLGPSSPTVAEIADIGKSVFTVSANDHDEGANGQVEYRLTTDTNATVGDSSLFSIEKSSGIVKVAQRLHAKAGFYYITVLASDKGAESKSTTKQYVIDVYDVNDAFPVFVHPDPNNPVVQILEDVPPGTLVIKLEAEDSDTGRNGLVEYSLDLQQEDPRTLQTFSLNSTSGELTTKVALDRETVENYKVVVKATDNGIPTNFSKSLTLLVRVKDINDEPPEFDRKTIATPFEVKFKENETSQACANVSVATDKDDNSEFTIICYYLVGAELQDMFQLDKSGSLCLKKDRVLDREVTAFTNLVIRASDDCNTDVTPSPLAPSFAEAPVLYDPSDTSLLWVRVNVTDVNDFRPVFVRHDLALGITRDVQVGKILYNLRDEVIDYDTETWGVSRFTNLTEFEAHPPRLATELADMNVGSPFTLFPNGSVKVNTYFNADMSGFFTVNVRVIDKGGLSDDALLRISLISDNQRLKVVFREGVAKVGTYRAEFSERMSAVTGLRIVVDKVQTHENENNVAENDKTDMFIHGEDLTTNEIIPAVRLLRIIDELSASTDMNILLNDLNIVEFKETSSSMEDNEMEKKLQMALILVSVILGVLCIILAVVLYFTYKRYSRKLKAATALAYVNSGIGPQETDLYKVDIPGTNMHSYEKQTSLDENALTRQAFPGFDEQEVCMNIFPEDRGPRHPHHHHHLPHHHHPYILNHGNANYNNNNNNHSSPTSKPGYLKAVITEHETSKNLQANDLAKDTLHDDKMMLSSSTPSPSPVTGSANSSIAERGLKARGSFQLPDPIRPIVVGGGSAVSEDYDVDMEYEDDDGTVTCNVNGLPSTEI
ncbi:cadherin-23-like isoform X3 [Littorina saxatilis]|uniref:cadherin-23-like isoform X3 n=1 Tax=Littorina saxatilis TaxID=31220 RepID=UPI0038B69373